MLILFLTTCGSGWLDCCPLLLSGAVAIRGGGVFPTERRLLASCMCCGPVAWRDVPAESVGCSGVTAWRRLRDWTEAGVWPRLHATLLGELRRADLLDLDDCAVDGSHIRALKGGTTSVPHRSTEPVPAPSIT